MAGSGSLLRGVGAFVNAPAGTRRLAAEAARALVAARLATLGSARRYRKSLGRPVAEGETASAVGPDAAAAAAEIGRMVARVAGAMPFRALCLQQALAARRMLARRGIPSMLCLGVNRDGAARAGGEAAHAWVICAGRVVAGDTDLARFAVVGRFV